MSHDLAQEASDGFSSKLTVSFTATLANWGLRREIYTCTNNYGFCTCKFEIAHYLSGSDLDDHLIFVLVIVIIITCTCFFQVQPFSPRVSCFAVYTSRTWVLYMYVYMQIYRFTCSCSIQPLLVFLGPNSRLDIDSGIGILSRLCRLCEIQILKFPLTLVYSDRL